MLREDMKFVGIAEKNKGSPYGSRARTLESPTSTAVFEMKTAYYRKQPLGGMSVFKGAPALCDTSRRWRLPETDMRLKSSIRWMRNYLTEYRYSR
jgi:hypothetical protein